MTIQTTGPNGLIYNLIQRALIENHRSDLVKFNIVNTEKLKQEFRDALKKDYDIKDIDESDILFCFEEVDQNEIEKPVDDKKEEDDGEVVDQDNDSKDKENKEEPKDDSISDGTEEQTDDSDTDSSENDDAKEDNDSEPSFGITGDDSEKDNTGDDSKEDDKGDLNEDQNIAEITYKDGDNETVKDIDSPESFGAWWKASNMDVDDPDGDLTDFDNVVINGKTYTQQDIEDVLKNQELTEDEDEIVKAVKEVIMKEEEEDTEEKDQGDEVENATEKDKEDAQGTTIGSSKTKENVVKAVARALYIDNPDDIQMFDINYQNKRCFFIKANIRK